MEKRQSVNLNGVVRVVSYDLRIREGFIKPRKVVGIWRFVEKDSDEWFECMSNYPDADCYSKTAACINYNDIHGNREKYFLLEDGFPFGFYDTDRKAIQFQIDCHRVCIANLEVMVSERKGTIGLYEYQKTLSIFKRELRLFKGCRTRLKKKEKRLAKIEYLDEWPF